MGEEKEEEHTVALLLSRWGGDEEEERERERRRYHYAKKRGSVAVKYRLGRGTREGGGGGRVATIEGRGLVVVVRVRGTVRAPVDLRATVESLTGYHHRTTAEPWFTGQSGTKLERTKNFRDTKIYFVTGLIVNSKRRVRWFRRRFDRIVVFKYFQVVPGYWSCN